MSIVKEKLLINEEYLKEYSVLPKNYNIDEVMSYVKVAELIHVKPILGESLYDELLDQIDVENISDANSTLLIKIYPLLGTATVYEAIPFIWSHVSEVGVTLGKSDNSESINLKDLDYILNHLKAQIQVRQNELTDFLRTHADSFPSYTETCCCEKKVKKNILNIYSNKHKCNNML